jgi:P27 family predicted phage terminase small subunit
MRGRKPTPSNIVRLRGNPGRRPRNKREPKPRLAIPECPAHLDAEAKREWRRVAPQLDELGLLTVLDGPALAIYCAAWSRWVAANKQVDELGLTVPGRNGIPKANPYIAVANQAQRLMMSMAAEFGMTPSSRSRIRVVPSPASDSFDELLNS